MEHVEDISNALEVDHNYSLEYQQPDYIFRSSKNDHPQRDEMIVSENGKICKGNEKLLIGR